MATKEQIELTDEDILARINNGSISSGQELTDAQVAQMTSSPNNTKSFLGAMVGASPLANIVQAGRVMMAPTPEDRKSILNQQINNIDAAKTEILSPMLSAASTYAFGLPKAMMNEQQRSAVFPEQDTLGGKALRIGLEVPALVAGGAMKVAGKLTQKIANPIARSFLQGMTAGGIQLNEKPSLNNQGTQALVGGVLNTLPVLKKLVNVGGENTAQRIAEKAAGGIDKIGDSLGDKYEELFKGINKGTTKTASIVESMDNVLKTYPDGVNMGKLGSIRERIAKQTEMSAADLHNLKQEIRTLIPKSVWKGSADANAIQNAQRDLYFKVTDELASIGGEQYRGLSREYRSFKEAERLVKKIVYNNELPSNAKLNNSLDVPTKRAMKLFDTQLPSQDKFLSDLYAWRRGQLARKAAKTMLPFGAAGAAGYAATKMIGEQ